jgi:preprotein translocase subunit Sec61beta
MRSLVLLLAVLALGGCMNVSDMAEGTRYHMSDAGLLDHSDSRRVNNLRIQPDSFIYIAQGAFVPPGRLYPRPNVWPKKPSKALSNTSRWCAALARRKAWIRPWAKPVPLRPYLLYTRFAKADDRIGNSDEWLDQEAWIASASTAA